MIYRVSIFTVVFLSVLFLVSGISNGEIRFEDGTQGIPPVFKSIEDITLDQNSDSSVIIDLWEYVRDEDTPLDRILFELPLPRKSYWVGSARASLDRNRYIRIAPDKEWSGVEKVIISANDGTSTVYSAFYVHILTSESGRLIEAENLPHEDRSGNWVDMHRWMRNGLISGEVGSELRFRCRGSHFAIRFWGKSLNLEKTYYRSPKTQQPWGTIKHHEPGVMEVFVDGEKAGVIDTSKTLGMGWTERLIRGNFDKGSHVIRIEVQKGHVALDGIREAGVPLGGFKAKAIDPFGTPLADILFRFQVPGKPEIRLRTGPDGTIPGFWGIAPGSYQVVIEPDSDPGYFRPPDPEENLLPQSRRIIIPENEIRSANVMLAYSFPVLRSLSLIRRPTGSVPSIVKKGDTLHVFCRYSGEASDFQAELIKKGARFSLPLVDCVSTLVATEKRKEHGLRLTFRISPHIPEGLWDLKISGDNISDFVARAVKVIKEFKNNYTYALISDIHMRSPKANRDHAEQLERAAREINRIRPEFVILTGDLTDCGSRPEYLRLLMALDKFQVPTFLIPGNHDYYYDSVRHYYQGRNEYAKYIGPGFYSFRYGNDLFMILDTGDYSMIHSTDIENFHFDQMSWIHSQLSQKEQAKKGMISLFAHWDYTRDIADYYPYYNQILRLVKRYPADLVGFGHRHRHFDGKYGDTDTRFIQSASIIKGHYRLIKIKDSRIEEVTEAQLELAETDKKK